MLEEAKKPMYDFVNYYENLIGNKKDSEINWIEVGYEMQKELCKLYLTNPEFVKKNLFLKEDEKPEDPEKRKYIWMNGLNFATVPYDKEQIEKSYTSFIEAFEKSDDDEYDLEYIGPFGDWEYFVPYLSYAYLEKQKWSNICERIKKELLY